MWTSSEHSKIFWVCYDNIMTHNNNNNKIWSFIKHSNERNRFFMHNCAEILKKLSEKT